MPVLAPAGGRPHTVLLVEPHHVKPGGNPLGPAAGGKQITFVVDREQPNPPSDRRLTLDVSGG